MLLLKLIIPYSNLRIKLLRIQLKESIEKVELELQIIKNTLLK